MFTVAVPKVWSLKFDELVKSQKTPVIVIPVKTGIQEIQLLMDSCGPIRSMTSFTEVTALEIFYETINLQPKTKKDLPILAKSLKLLEAAIGFEPMNNGFADRCLSLLAMPPFCGAGNGT